MCVCVCVYIYIYIHIYVCVCVLLTKKKDVQLESCKLSFIWGKMRTAAQEAASQIALRDSSKVEVGERQ